MTYQDIDLYMKRTGLDKEPAFEYLHFLTEPIESPDDRRILGLYYPQGEEANKGQGYLPPSTIILPPDASEGTLLHELGHRYGHFYFNDISESFAENFRKKNQKEVSMKMIAEHAVCEGCPELLEGAQLCRYCEYGGSPNHGLAFAVKAEVGPLVLRGPVGATITGSISKVEVVWQGAAYRIYPAPSTPVKIPAGGAIYFNVTYAASNPDGGFWSVAITMVTTDGLLPNYDITNGPYPLGGTTLAGVMKLDAMGAMSMPDHAVTIRFTPWGHQEVKSSPPPQNLW